MSEFKPYQFEWYPVEVTLKDDRFTDEIKGRNEADALINAWENWNYAEKIRLIIK